MQKHYPFKKSILFQVGVGAFLYSMIVSVALARQPFLKTIKPEVSIKTVFNRLRMSVEENGDRFRVFKGVGPFWVALGATGKDRLFLV